MEYYGSCNVCGETTEWGEWDKCDNCKYKNFWIKDIYGNQTGPFSKIEMKNKIETGELQYDTSIMNMRNDLKHEDWRQAWKSTALRWEGQQPLALTRGRHLEAEQRLALAMGSGDNARLGSDSSIRNAPYVTAEDRNITPYGMHLFPGGALQYPETLIRWDNQNASKRAAAVPPLPLLDIAVAPTIARMREQKEQSSSGMHNWSTGQPNKTLLNVDRSVVSPVETESMGPKEAKQKEQSSSGMHNWSTGQPNKTLLNVDGSVSRALADISEEPEKIGGRMKSRRKTRRKKKSRVRKSIRKNFRKTKKKSRKSRSKKRN
jgi:hypothetical protein